MVLARRCLQRAKKATRLKCIAPILTTLFYQENLRKLLKMERLKAHPAQYLFRCWLFEVLSYCTIPCSLSLDKTYYDYNCYNYDNKRSGDDDINYCSLEIIWKISGRGLTVLNNCFNLSIVTTLMDKQNVSLLMMVYWSWSFILYYYLLSVHDQKRFYEYFSFSWRCVSCYFACFLSTVL